MFGAQNQINPAVPDPRAVNVDSPIHTMQDDLDILQGKVPVAAPLPPMQEPVAAPFAVQSGAPAAAAPQATPVASEQRPSAAPAPTTPSATNAAPTPVASVSQAPAAPAAVPPRVQPVFEPRPQSPQPPQAYPGSPFGAPQPIPVNQNQSVAANIPQNYASQPVFEAKHGIGWGKVALITLSLIIVLSLGGAGYFFWMTRYSQPTEQEETPVVVEEPKPVVEEPKPVVAEKKYTVDKPNYLSIPTKTATQQEIFGVLNEVKSGVTADSHAVPVEFVVTDESNSPVAFKSFAALLGMKLSSNLLNNLDDDFSLYMHNNGGQDLTRLGIAVKSKGVAKIKSAILAEEKTLVEGISPLFLGESYSKTAAPFKSSQYMDLSVKYTNVNDSGLSVDYALKGDYLFIGTSKNTLRSILDKGVSEPGQAVSVSQSSTPVASSSSAKLSAGYSSGNSESFSAGEFKSCEKGFVYVNSKNNATYIYTVVGQKELRCEIEVKYIEGENMTDDSKAQKMTCLFDNSKTLNEAVGEINQSFQQKDNSKVACSGPLYDQIKLQN